MEAIAMINRPVLPLSTRRIVTIVVNLQDWPGQNHDETGISRHWQCCRQVLSIDFQQVMISGALIYPPPSSMEETYTKRKEAEPQLFYPRPWLGIAVGVHCQCHEEKHCTWIGLSSSCAVMRHSRFGIFWADNGRNLKPAVLEPLNNLLFSRLSGTFAPKTAITILLSILQRVLACLTQYIPPFHQYPVYPFGPSPLSLSTIPQ